MERSACRGGDEKRRNVAFANIGVDGEGGVKVGGILMVMSLIQKG